MTYDDRGRITSAAYTIDGTNYPVQYAYNAADELTALTYPSGRVVQPDYDSVGRLNHIADANAPANPYLTINSADYSGANLVKQLTLGNGVIGQFNYNDHLQISALRYYNPAASPGTPDVLNLSYDYGAGNNGQIQAMHYFTAPNSEDLTKSESFRYDAWRRLIQGQTLDLTASGTWQLQWGYDRLGNRTSQTLTGGTAPPPVYQPTFAIDAGTNRVVGYCYDSAGNLSDEGSCPTPGNPHRYSYDGANRLAAVYNGIDTATYSYFGSLRIRKVAGGTTTVHVYSGTKPIAEYVGGQLRKEYIYSGPRLLATIAGGTITYHHPDHLSNRAETDASANVTRTFGHFPYGEVWYEGGTPDKWKFTTYERDSSTGETGLDYAQFRHYSPGQGRFISVDLLGGDASVPQSLNRYAYVLNDPVKLVDPLGLAHVDDCEAGWVWDGDMCIPMPGGGSGGGSGNQHPLLLDPTAGGGGGGGGAGSSPAKLPSNMLKALQDCLNKIFGVTLQSFVLTQPGQSGSFTGAKDGQQLSFTNDVKTFNTAALNMIRFRSSTPPAGDTDTQGLTISGRRVTHWWVGLIPDYFSWRNFDLSTSYTASDIAAGAMTATQIHELGHQLAQTLRLAEPNTEDSYASRLQDCVNQNSKPKPGAQ